MSAQDLIQLEKISKMSSAINAMCPSFNWPEFNKHTRKIEAEKTLLSYGLIRYYSMKRVIEKLSSGAPMPWEKE